MDAIEKLSAAKQAIENSWDAWLAEHCVSIPEAIEAAVKSAVSDWLDANHEWVLRAITDGVAKAHKSRSESP